MGSLRIGAALLTSALATLLFAGVATAAKPEVLARNEALAGEPFVDTETCPGLAILNEADITRSRTLYFDHSGNETRLVIHVRYRLWFTNLANGTTLTSPGVRHIELDFVRGTFTDTGVYRNVSAPGEGTVFHQSGRVVEDLETAELLSISGPHDEHVGDFDAFCTALAG